MGLFDIFNTSKLKQELESLRREHEELKASLTPDMRDALSLKKTLSDLQSEEAEQRVAQRNLLDQIADLSRIAEERRKVIITLDDEVLVQSFGLYEPVFTYDTSEEYKDSLALVRQKEKQMLKEKTAATAGQAWTVNESKAEGKKMVADTQKLLLRAFNSECDALMARVKYNNYDSILRRLQASRDAISKLGGTIGVSISKEYFDLKVQELQLTLEYRQKKQEEKEAQKAARAELREAAKLQKEIEEQRKKIEKEKQHYESAYKQLLAQLANNKGDEALLRKKAEMDEKMADIEQAMKDIDYREANQRAGYVYVISNIGAFGKDVYKIGMTRRLNPQDRVDELGDASVPFNFDVHAMIFSDNAPALEVALHRAFDDKKLNRVNHRREFFHVSLDEIKQVIRDNYDKTVEFIDVPDAEQYRISQKMKEKS